MPSTHDRSRAHRPGRRLAGSTGIGAAPAELLDYLRSGLSAGMQLPDPADQSLRTIRVVAWR